MRMRLLLPVVTLFLLTLIAGCGAPESEAPQMQAPCDRACLESYVDRYMDAMMNHKPESDLFAEGCRFTENGVRLPLGEGLWAGMVGQGTYKFYVPDTETRQVAFIGTALEEPQEQGGTPRSVAIALRLKIENGLISEAEQLVIRPESNLLNPERGPSGPSAADRIEAMGKELGNPHPIFAAALPENDRPGREKMIEVANYYFSGMQKNDGQGYYPFTDDCDRYENGSRSTNVPLAPGQVMPDPAKETVYSSNWGCKEQFESGLIHFVTRIRDRRFVAVDRERGVVFSFCFFDHAAGESRHFTTPDGRQVVAGPAEPWTWQVAELFKIENAKIRRIEAVLQRCPYGMNSGWSTYEDGMSDKIQIVE
jgi:hypothetical protein